MPVGLLPRFAQSIAIAYVQGKRDKKERERERKRDKKGKRRQREREREMYYDPGYDNM